MIRNKKTVPRKYENCIDCIEKHNNHDDKFDDYFKNTSCQVFNCSIIPEYIHHQQELNYLKILLKDYIKPKYL